MRFIKICTAGGFELHDDEVGFIDAIPKKDLHRYMMMPLHIEELVTLGILLNSIPPLLWEIIPWKFDEHLEEMRLRGQKDVHIDYIEVSLSLEVTKSKTHADVQVHPSVAGVGFPLAKDDEYGSKKGARLHYSLSTSSMASLKNLPIVIKRKNSALIRLKNEYNFIDGSGEDYNPSLIEVLNLLVYELTWYGAPNERDEFVKDLKEKFEDTKNKIVENN